MAEQKKSRRSISFGDLNPNQGNDDDIVLKDWLSDLPLIKFDVLKKLTVRPVGPVYSMARHWPKAPKSGNVTPPLLCPRYDGIEQKFKDDLSCCLHEDFNDKAQKILAFECIVREWQEGKQRKSNPIGVLVVSSSLASDLVEIMGINKADIADPEKGCDLRIGYNRDEKGPKKWSVQRVDRTPLTDEEKEYERIDLEAVAPDFSDKKFAEEYSRAMRAKLVRLGYYVIPLDNGREGWEGYKKDPNGKPYTQFPDIAPDDNKGGRDAEPRRRTRDEGEAPQERPAARTRSSAEEDADLGLQRRRPSDDDETPPAPPKRGAVSEADEDAPVPAKKLKQQVAKPADEDAPFDAGEDEKPAAKPAKKGVSAPAEHAEWSTKHSIAWKMGAEGPQPTCFGDFEGTPKCKKCPQRTECLG